MEEITLYQAIKRMREMSIKNIDFSMSYATLNKSKNTSVGIKNVTRAMLTSTRVSTSDLLSYIDINNQDAPRNFQLCLLLTFNNYKIKI